MATDLEQKVWEGLRDFERIEDLDYTPQACYLDGGSYAVVTMQQILGKLFTKNRVFVVAGAFFGDEAKGKVTNTISDLVDIVVRLNSGSNAGHTVIINGEKVVLHVVPSGIFNEKTINYVGPECVVDPVEFMEEINQLVKHNVDYKERLFIGNVHIVTPYHKLMDLIRNIKDVDKEGNITLGNVSTLKGMSPVHSSMAYKTTPRLDDLFGDEATLRTRLEKDIKTYYGMLHSWGYSEEDLLNSCDKLNDKFKRIPDHIVDFLKAKDKIQYMLDMYKEIKENELFPERRNVKWEIQEALKNGKTILVECPQSFFLSRAEGSHHRTATAADTTADGVLACSGINVRRYGVVIINVHKAPVPSRIGAGENPGGFTSQTYFSDRRIDTLNKLDPKACADFDKIQKLFWESIGKNGIAEPVKYTDDTGTYSIGEAMAISSARKYEECGATTKKPRMTGLIDCVAHANAMRSQGDYTVLSAMDRGDILEKTGMVIAYVYFNADNKIIESCGKKYHNGDVIRPGDPYPNEKILKFCHPIIYTVEGWKDEPIAAEEWDGLELPRGAQAYVEAFEHFSGAKVIAIGNGPKDDNMIYIKKLTEEFDEFDLDVPPFED